MQYVLSSNQRAIFVWPWNDIFFTSCRTQAKRQANWNDLKLKELSTQHRLWAIQEGFKLRLPPTSHWSLRLSSSRSVAPQQPLFRHRSAAMICQRTTSAVMHMFQSMGYHCTNYLDDFGGDDSAENAQFTFRALGDLFSWSRVVAREGLCAISKYDFPRHPVSFRRHDHVHDCRPSFWTPIPLSITAWLKCHFSSGFAVFAGSHGVRYSLRLSCLHLHV